MYKWRSVLHYCLILSSEASGAQINFFHLAIDFNCGLLNIWTPGPTCSAFGMADIIASTDLSFTIWSFTCSHFSPFDTFLNVLIIVLSEDLSICNALKLEQIHIKKYHIRYYTSSIFLSWNFIYGF